MRQVVLLTQALNPCYPVVPLLMGKDVSKRPLPHFVLHFSKRLTRGSANRKHLTVFGSSLKRAQLSHQRIIRFVGNLWRIFSVILLLMVRDKLA